MPLSGDGKRFSKIIRTADYECDIHGRMRLKAVLQHMQEISSAHLDALGLPYTLLREHRQVFLLSKIRLEMARRPTAAEYFELVTVPLAPVGAQFIRRNTFLDSEGRTLMRADATWMLVDPESHRILRPAEFIGSLRYTDGGGSSLPRYRLQAPEAVPAGGREVRLSDLDVNRHMNNAVYADICEDFLPQQAAVAGEPCGFYIHYRNEARLGDLLQVFRGELGPGCTYFKAEKADGICFEAALQLGEAPDSKRIF